MNANKEISFPSPQIPTLLGYFANFDENGDYHIGYRGIPSFDAYYEGNELYEAQWDMSCFCIFDKIQYQNVGNAKAPLIRVIDSIRRIKNGCCLQHWT